MTYNPHTPSSTMHFQNAILAPLAGVSDIPFRRVCQDLGAELTYIEMLSATAICYNNEKTFEMMEVHPTEKQVGVQITSRNAEEMGRAAQAVQGRGFHSIDINMGCPVKKVVKVGCGSAILKDPQRVYDTTYQACLASDIPVSVKIRLGWDHSCTNWSEVADAAIRGGAAWITIHGRTRSDTYASPVQLGEIYKAAEQLSIPVIGNGNLFHLEDVQLMQQKGGVAGVMISRGALGNPWLFRDVVHNKVQPVTPEEWQKVVLQHIRYQEEYFTQKNLLSVGSVCMRKHLIWYLSGWPGAKPFKQRVNTATCFSEFTEITQQFTERLIEAHVPARQVAQPQLSQQDPSSWDPKFEMDRKLDRGVSQIGYEPGL
ncbi:MAG: tRNA-dihydrouridine synthase [Zetaproteobacteria bacterium]|nr:tRNA-dihydrouridine synthase [Zetaproteobacteria bacterium]